MRYLTRLTVGAAEPIWGNASAESAVASFVNAYLWHADGNVRHHLRAESVDEARARIAATHGEDVAQRAVIRPLATAASDNSQSAAA